MVNKPKADGRGPNTDFSHICDTLSGSSGSSAINENGAVIGLYHHGIGGEYWNEKLRASDVKNQIPNA